MVTTRQHWTGKETPIDSEERQQRAAVKARRVRALADRLKLLRTHRGLTQEALGGRAGVPRQIISGLEKGSRPRPRDGTLERLAEALGVTPPQLKGCDAIPELSAAEPGLAADAAAAEAPGAEAPPPADAAVGFTSLLRLPPGSVVELEYRPDGSVALTLRIPNHGPPPPR